MVVKDEQKVSAIKTFLKDMTDISLKAYICDPNENSVKVLNGFDIGVYQTAFKGNSIFEKTVSTLKGFNEIDYCVFKKEVIQFWNDDLSDYLVNYSGLVSNIAREILNLDVVQFCIAGD